MEFKNLLTWLLLVLLLSGCDNKENNANVPPEGCLNLSDLETKQDYYLPFGILNDADNIRTATLNGSLVEFSYGDFIGFEENGFFELILSYQNEQQANDTILFTTNTPERENSEWGIKAWAPVPFRTEILGPESIEVYYPRHYTDSIKVPFIFYVKESGAVKRTYCDARCVSSGEKFRIKQGAGSVSINSTGMSDRVYFLAGGRHVAASVTRFPDNGMELHGVLASHTEIPANTLVRINADLEIAPTGSLKINEGVVILISEAVDVNVNGPVTITGSPQNPVFITCNRKDKFWGGFITRVPGGTIDAHYAIFCQSGYHDSEGYNWGHSGRQALFYTENSSLKLDHCFITDHTGQIFFPQNASLTLDDILVQRVQTGGQINTSVLTLRNSVFTDFPDDSNTYYDNDNDALYLSETDAEVSNTTFMFAKDDGLDSGNEGGGTVNLTNCRFEACFHEGAALSSGNNVFKYHNFKDCVFTNCGQGLELGFSSPNHLVTAINCTFLDNGVGIRYGDNYNWSHVEGKMVIINSSSLYNDRDVWNMVRMNWSPRLGNITFENTVVSEFCPQYPGLIVKKKDN